jgi:metal-responsive CopG/Arc/MetJ family transcriptional regulator
MRTVQMTRGESLVDQVDTVVRELKTTRSAFTRDALRIALRSTRVRDMEARHRAGYARKPVAAAEFASGEREHAWGDS